MAGNRGEVFKNVRKDGLARGANGLFKTGGGFKTFDTLEICI